ncbi:D-alanyl-D-alanine carboxypeptidase [Candidatus Woesebacteria bacterium]|nr:D-alanyl-D-alanine carboxypeptidase [Candidatus Woesebacteria bacterium]
MKLFLDDSRTLLFLSLLSFVFVASVALVLSVSKTNYHPETSAKAAAFAPLPVISKDVSFPVISAQAALAIDMDSGVTLYEKRADSPFLPASTTKIITALVAIEYYPLNLVVKVPEVKVEGQKMGLIAGEEIEVEDLLYGLLVYSANDAAEVLALNFPGGRDLFIVAMNLKAKELGLAHSKFSNPAGLDDGDGHVTTAKDLIRVSEIAMKDPLFAKIVGTKEKTVTSTNGRIVHKLRNINELLGSVDGVKGVKTGWTENARENLVTYLERDGHKVMIALLGSQDRFGETRELIDWIFASYDWQAVAPPLTLRNILP